MRVLVHISVVGTLLAVGGVARAQVGGNIDLNAFRPAMDSRGYITVNASQVLGHTESRSVWSPTGATRSSASRTGTTTTT